MAEQFSHAYRRLFELRVLHHFWLDDGATLFDLLGDATRREARLLAYDVRRFLEVSLAPESERALRGWRGVWKSTPLGGLAAVPEGTALPPQAHFDVVVTVRDPAFFQYTALTLRPQKIHELYHAPEKKLYRLKENVPVVSNLTGVSRGTGANERLFLSREIPSLDPGDGVESLVLSGPALAQLTADSPGAASQQLAADATQWPVFVHQGDIPVIVPPAGLAGAPARGLELSATIPDAIFLLVRLQAVRAGDDRFSLVDAGGLPKVAPPVFEVRLKNRSSVWRYLNRATGAVLATETKPLPHTYFGNAGTRPKPAQGLVKPEKSGGRITQLISEIFVQGPQP